ncbi:hypothetical protein FB451DRAFT_1407228 [Mycena latifolia]|nr:hypothetical protein FB451DRAFT_1407228 [Mycena latifolia]
MKVQVAFLLKAFVARLDGQERDGIRREEYKTILRTPQSSDPHLRLSSTLILPNLSTAFSALFSSFMPINASSSAPISTTTSRATSPVLPGPNLDPRNPECASLPAVKPRRPDTPTLPACILGVDLPRYALISNALSRMNKVQFLNRDTYGTIGEANRLPLNGTNYQLLYDSAADVRQRYADGETLECRPIAVSSAQSEYLGMVRDAEGRDCHRYQGLSGSIDSYNSKLRRPCRMVGAFTLDVYPAPSQASQPWALEAPYPSRQTIQSLLSTYDAHQRPFYAFPANTTSLRPVLDYLQPPLSHPPGLNPLPMRTKWDELFTTAPSLTDRIPAIGKDWEFMGHSEDGQLRWREPLPASDLPTPQPGNFREEPVPFVGEDPPDVPDDTESPQLPQLSIRNEVPPSLADLTVVQVPDPNDRFSRPVPRYVVPQRRYVVPRRREDELELIGRAASELARDVRRSQQARRRIPFRHATARRPALAPLQAADEESDSDMDSD